MVGLHNVVERRVENDRKRVLGVSAVAKKKRIKCKNICKEVRVWQDVNEVRGA